MQEKEIDGKAIWSYGNPEAEKVLIQLVGEHEISGIEQEFHAIQDRTSEEFYMIAWRVNNWNDELSPCIVLIRARHTIWAGIRLPDYLLCGHLARRTVLWELQQPHRQYGFQTFWNICKKIGYKVV